MELFFSGISVDLCGRIYIYIYIYIQKRIKAKCRLTFSLGLSGNKKKDII